MKLGYLLEDYQKTGIKIPLNIKLAKKTSSVLIAGKSGSGKSLSARWYIGNLLTTGESAVYNMKHSKVPYLMLLVVMPSQ